RRAPIREVLRVLAQVLRSAAREPGAGGEQSGALQACGLEIPDQHVDAEEHDDDEDQGERRCSPDDGERRRPSEAAIHGGYLWFDRSNLPRAGVPRLEIVHITGWF